MKPSDDLFNLISSLSRLERGYFSKYASVHVKGEENNYKKLFNTLCGMNSFSDEKLKKRLQGEEMLGYLSTAKNQLYNTILRTMRPYYEDYNLDTHLREMLNDIDLLLSKGLFKQARKQTAKLINLCKENEKHFILLEATRREMQTNSELQIHYDEHTEKLNLIRKNQLTALKKMENVLTYEYLYTNVKALINKYGKISNHSEKEELEQLFQDELLQHESKAISQEAKIYFHLIHTERAMLLVDFKEADKSISKIISILMNKHDQTNKFPQLYFITLLKKGRVLIALGKHKDASHLILRIKRLPNQFPIFKNDNFKSVIFFESSILELNFHISCSDFRKAAEQADFFETEAKEFEDRINTATKLQFYLKCSISFLLAGENRKAWNCLQKIISENYESQNRSFVNFIRVYYLYVHYELGNKDHLFYVLRSTYRKMEKQGAIPDFEKLLLSYIRINVFRGKRLLSAASNTKMLEEIARFDSKESDFDYGFGFSYQLWAESKMRGLSMQKIAAEKYKARYQANISPAIVVCESAQLN